MSYRYNYKQAGGGQGGTPYQSPSQARGVLSRPPGESNIGLRARETASAENLAAIEAASSAAFKSIEQVDTDALWESEIVPTFAPLAYSYAFSYPGMQPIIMNIPQGNVSTSDVYSQFAESAGLNVNYQTITLPGGSTQKAWVLSKPDYSSFTETDYTGIQGGINDLTAAQQAAYAEQMGGAEAEAIANWEAQTAQAKESWEAQTATSLADWETATQPVRDARAKREAVAKGVKTMFGVS